MSPKTARIGIFTTFALSALFLIIPTTIAFVSIADGSHAGKVASENYWRERTSSPLERNDLGKTIIAGVAADWSADVELHFVDREAQREVPSVKLAEMLGPWPVMISLIIAVLGMLVFGCDTLFDALFTVSDKKCKTMINRARRQRAST